MAIVGPPRLSNIRAYVVANRQETIRLNRVERDDLADALTPKALRRSIVERIEDALDFYRLSRQTRRQYNIRRLRGVTLRRLKKARALANEVHQHPLAAQLRPELDKYIHQLENLADLQKRPAKRPVDTDRMTLAGHVAWALDDAGIPLTIGRPTATASVLIRVLQFVLARADVIDGKSPSRRPNLHKFASGVLMEYPSWRRHLEDRDEAIEKYERMCSRK